jgi:hypothetical protein
MKHEFIVKFERDIYQDIECVKLNFPNAQLYSGLIAQMCLELNIDSSLNYEIVNFITLENDSSYFIYAKFVVEAENSASAFSELTRNLLHCYDEYDIAGFFKIFTTEKMPDPKSSFDILKDHANALIKKLENNKLTKEELIKKALSALEILLYEIKTPEKLASTIEEILKCKKRILILRDSTFVIV